MVKSVKLNGIEGVCVDVECTISEGIGIHLVGIVDAAVKEILLRTVTALQANGYTIPGKKIVFTLNPVETYKSGSAYDLAIALALIRASGQDSYDTGDHSGNLDNMLETIGEWLVVGELGLDGSVRAVNGCVQAVEVAIASGCKGVIIPEDNASEIVGAFEKDVIPVYGVRNLAEAIGSIAGNGTYASTVWEKESKEPDIAPVTFDQIAGHELGKRALEIAAAGGHSLLMIGAPGSGKATLARALVDILPRLTQEEKIVVAEAFSAAGRTGDYASGRRPFRAPHVSASKPALLGGGRGENIIPGEVTLANRGVLFIDEFAEAPKSTFEALRIPVEDHNVTIARLHSKVSMPASFILVGASNPCPCGYFGEGDRCTCTAGLRAAYLSRLDNPLTDHFDLHLWTHPVDDARILDGNKGDSAEVVAERVAKARAVQMKRFANDGIKTNAEMTPKLVSRYCTLSDECSEMVSQLIDRLGLHPRAYGHILKVARTIADLAGYEDIQRNHLIEAAGFRFLDRRNHKAE